MVLHERLLDRIVLTAKAESTSPSTRNPEWSRQEDQFLKDNFAWLTDAELGEQLGRSEIAVHLRWSRDLHMPSRSKHPQVVTAHQAAAMLGIDGHKIGHWVDVGLIPGRLMPGDRKIRLINRQAFRRWVLNPMNWVWFNPKKVQDPELARMLSLRAARWGDEWWSTVQVARYHGVDTGDVKRYIAMGRLPSFRLPVSLGGRQHDRHWSNHFVLKSDALQVKFFKKGKGVFEYPSQFTPAADRWLLKARDDLKFTFVHIGRTMKIGAEKCNPKTGTATSNPTIAYRYHQLKAKQRKTRTPKKHG